MIRILLYPDLDAVTTENSFSQNSYIEFLSEMINTFHKKRQDLFWYILAPKSRKKAAGLQHENNRKKLSALNTKFIHIEVPDGPLGKVHFDLNELTRKLRCTEYPIDLIFCHKPEIARQLKLFFRYRTNLTPPIIGYLHLFELPDIDWKGVFEYTIFGLTEMDVCFLNTRLQKQQVHEEARNIFSSSVCGELHEKLKTLPPIVVPRNVKPNKSGTYLRTIVWNHQVDKESDFMEFQKTILNLRKMRDDFKVWIPRMKTSHKLSREYRWVIAGGYTSKKDYLSKLRSCCVGVSPKSLHSEVQGSVIEGNECGIPYLIFNDPVYKEINKNSDFYKTRKELITLLNKYLNDSNYRNLMAGQSISNLIMKHNIKKKVDKINNTINQIQKKRLAVRSRKTNHIISLIKKHKSLSHRELLGPKILNWKIENKFDGYRKAILNTKKIDEVRFQKIKGRTSKRRYEWKSIYRYNDD